jgi:hypothetical protein
MRPSPLRQSRPEQIAPGFAKVGVEGSNPFARSKSFDIYQRNSGGPHEPLFRSFGRSRRADWAPVGQASWSAQIGAQDRCPFLEASHRLIPDQGSDTALRHRPRTVSQRLAVARTSWPERCAPPRRPENPEKGENPLPSSGAIERDSFRDFVDFREHGSERDAG